MALLWIEGFETRQDSTYFARVYASYSGLAGVNTTAGVKGFGSAISGANMQFETRALVGSLQNTWIVQFALRKSNANPMSTNFGHIMLRDDTGAGGDQLELRWVESGSSSDVGAFKFEVRRGTTVLATSRIFSYASSVQGWWTFQFKATVRTGTNGSYELKAWNWLGVSETVLAFTGSVNTANQGTDGADRISFRTNNGGTAAFDLDNIVVLDSTGSVNNDLTSVPFIVYGELPNADVAGELDWVPSSAGAHNVLVDDTGTSPNGTDEVTSDVVGDVDLYGFTQSSLDLIPTAAPPTVAAIMVDVEALMKTSGTRTVRVRVKDSTNQADSTTDLVYNDTAKISRFAVMEQNPTGTPAPWTVAVLKTIELGPKLNA